MGAFVQIIEYQTAHFDEVRALGEQFRDERLAEDGDGGPVTVTVTEDRDRPGSYFTVVEFPSYEAAMKNSDSPQTQEFAAKMATLCDGPPRYHNLTVIDRWQG